VWDAIEIDRPVYRGDRATIGAFRCPVGHPSFRDSGPTSGCLVVFPRTSVWIRHEGSARFLSDPTIVTIYNRAQRYERFPVSPDGDRCDWFSVPDELAREIAGTFDPDAGESERPFRAEWAPSTAALYLQQRRLVGRVERGECDALETEEEVIRIVAAVLTRAHGRSPAALPTTGAAPRRHRDLAAAARAELGRAPGANRSVHQLASTLGTSPFHLCRVFRSCTGVTMHEYRRDLRVRIGLELLQSGVDGTNGISAVAHQLGFASHSHFVRATRRQLGQTPSALRRALLA
jgi:AraC-like DNA-binding protein